MESYDDEEEMHNDLPFINPPAFDDESIENKLHKMIEGKNVRIVKNAVILEIIEDEEN